MDLPVLIVASVLACIYGLFISRKWYLALAQGVIMLVCVYLCGLLLPQWFTALAKARGVAQIFGVFLGSVVIFAAFGLPARIRSDRAEREQAQETDSINEEDQ